jgi:hypothetical protein
VDAHVNLSGYLEKPKRSEYWKQPEVWPDLKAAFEKFFRFNPDAVGYRHNYALYAWKCEAWKELNKQIPSLGEINYDYFGGKAEYQRMLREAKAHASP